MTCQHISLEQPLSRISASFQVVGLVQSQCTSAQAGTFITETPLYYVHLLSELLNKWHVPCICAVGSGKVAAQP